MTKREKEDLKIDLLNRFAKRATYDKELNEWSINFDTACEIMAIAIDNLEERDEREG